MKTTTRPYEVLSPGIVQVLEGSSVALNWNYSLSSGFLIAMIKFNGDGIAMISAGGLVGALNAHFQERFNVSSTLGRASLFINNVTVADDKTNGEFSCELLDSNADIWKRAIQVEVIGELESASDKKGNTLGGQTGISLNGYVSPNRIWNVHS